MSPLHIASITVAVVSCVWGALAVTQPPLSESRVVYGAFALMLAGFSFVFAGIGWWVSN